MTHEEGERDTRRAVNKKVFGSRGKICVSERKNKQVQEWQNER